MLVDDFQFNNSQFLQRPMNGVKPKCAFCSADINILAMDLSWLFFVYQAALHYAHAECMQQNVNDGNEGGLADWLGSMYNLGDDE